MRTNPDILDILMTAVHLAANELAKTHPQGESLESSILIWQKYLIQQAIYKQNSMSEGERILFRLTHLIPDVAPKKVKKRPCEFCSGTGECQGIAARESSGKGCNCASLADCASLGECAICCGEGTEEI